jgi:hypothetical protein
VNSAVAGLVASLGLALVIASLTLPGRQTSGVVNSTAHGLGYLEQSSLGYTPHWTSP